MARKAASQTQADTSSNGEVERGPRKPREYRFEKVDSDKVVTPLGLVLSHRDSAKAVMAFLNANAELTQEGESFRFVEVILYQ